MRWVAEGEPWAFRFIGEYGSPQKQLMVAYTRLPDQSPNPASNVQDRSVDDKIKAGGATALVLRARRKASTLISPY